MRRRTTLASSMLPLLMIAVATVALPAAVPVAAVPTDPQGVQAAPPSITPVSRTDDWAVARQNEVLSRVREAKGRVPVVFIGDSITQGWEGEGAAIWKEKIAPLGALNLGVSGDQTEHVLWRLDQAPLTALDPRMVVVMIGTNNARAGASAGDVVHGVRAVVRKILEQCPGAKVLLLDIFPRGESFNELRGRNAQANQVLSRVDAFGPEFARVLWRPVGDGLVELDGTISKSVMPDFLHLSAEGYARWERAIHEAIAAPVAEIAPSTTVPGGK